MKQKDEKRAINQKSKKDTNTNLKMFYKPRGLTFDIKSMILFDDCITIVCKDKYEGKHGERPKILTPKQMLHRLSITLAQVKACNAFTNLKNEIRKIKCVVK